MIISVVSGPTLQVYVPVSAAVTDEMNNLLLVADCLL